MYRRTSLLHRRITAAVLLALLGLALAAAPVAAGARSPRTIRPAAPVSTNFSFDTNTYLAETPASGRTAGSVILTLLQSLVVIAIIAAGLYYFLRFIARKQNQGNVNRDTIRVIAQNAVAVGRYITVVKILNSYYILGLAEGGVSLIREVTDRAEIDSLREMELQAPRQDRQSTPSFQDYLKDVFGRLRKPEKSAGAKPSPDRILGFLNTQKERLNRMNGKQGGSEGGKP